MEPQKTAPPEHRYHIGMRIVKTVTAVFLCGLLAWARSASAFYSMIAAVVCVQNSAGKTIESSVNRMVGTLIGGAAGVLMVYALNLAGVLYVELARYTLSALLLIPIIQLCLVVKKPGSAAMACIVFLCVTVNYSPEDTPVIYAIERLFETLVGVALACGVDILLPYRTPPAPEEGPAAEAERPPEDAPQRDSGEELDGAVETVHVKNTGRCRELLVPGCTVYLERCPNPARKTKFDLIAVEKARPGLPPLLVNLDAQAPNRVFGEWLASGRGAELGLPKPDLLRPETTWGNSRFDFYWELSEAAALGPPREPERTLPRRGFVEVKGCTLEENGLALFPDAPTERGVKHLRELAACRRAGYEAAVCFVLQMAGMRSFSPNDATHPAFGAALRAAAEAGVSVLAVECTVAADRLTMAKPVPVLL